MTTREQEGVAAPSGPVAPTGVNHLVLNVTDIERAHDFWTRIIGFHQVGEIEPRPERPNFRMRFYSGSTENHHDVALAQVVEPVEPAQPWSMVARKTGLNHVAITWPDRESWMRQVEWMQSQGVTFHSRVEHGMTHSVYVSDPDGHGIEVLYELPREIWQGDINAALNYAVRKPTDGPEALDDDANYKVFGNQ